MQILFSRNVITFSVFYHTLMLSKIILKEVSAMKHFKRQLLSTLLITTILIRIPLSLSFPNIPDALIKPSHTSEIGHPNGGRH
jgi:hypothetical protein